MSDLFSDFEEPTGEKIEPSGNSWKTIAADIMSIRRPAGGFKLILSDWPWEILMRSKKGYGKSPQKHYQCIPTPVIASVPIWKLAATDSIHVMWGTWAMLKLQMGVMEAQGFTYKSGAPWFKGSPLSAGDDCEDEDWNPSFAGGYLWRSCSEMVLIGTRGEPKLKPERRRVRGAFFDPQREHSRKPDEQYEKCEALIAGPYLELFSRTDRPGWTSFGNEAGRFGVAAP